MIRRRELITLLGGVAAWPLAARAQQGGRMRRIGYLTPLDEDDPPGLTSLRSRKPLRAWVGPRERADGPSLDRR